MRLPDWLQSLRHQAARLRARMAMRMRVAYDENGIRIPPPHLIFTGARLFGCDYNKKLIAWCRANLSLAEFSISKSEGKLQYGDRSFDFIYAGFYSFQ
jgi:hypothetical protein